MKRVSRPIRSLTPVDFAQFAVWEYDLDGESEEGSDETWVRPVRRYPVAHLENRVIGTSVLLQNGTRMDACLSNITVDNDQSTREFLLLSVWFAGEWVDLARYFDGDNETRGPEAFARRLGLPVAEVFPIRYDLSNHAKGSPSVLKGTIDSEPKRRLTEDERMSLLF